MKKGLKFYNVLFPVWFFYFYPSAAWLLILPVNLIVDSVVLLGSLAKEKVEFRKEIFKKSILKIWLIGFASDFVGALLLFGLELLLETYTEINTVFFPEVTLIAIIGVLVAGCLIYFLNKKLSFEDCPLTKNQIHRICLYLAVFTAPYTMLVPLYG